MQFKEGKEQFIQLWGTLGSDWGINRTMAQVHALLLISRESLSTEQVMEELGISRGNANMNLRELIDWNLVYRELKKGERKEFFRAEQDLWEVAKRVAHERRRREIQPLLNNLKEIAKIDGKKDSPEAEAFADRVKEIQRFVGKLDSAVETVIKAEENWFFGRILKIMK
ncbi:MAG: transcriptional regulator [Bacteroidetes bacterium]|nr:transcriptional regulator [Bacteroidota bacterium]